MKSREYNQRVQTDMGPYGARGPSPNNQRQLESPVDKDHFEMIESSIPNKNRGQDGGSHRQSEKEPININIRSTLLGQMDNQYEENQKNATSNFRTSRFDNTFERREDSKERSGNRTKGIYNQSPYAQNNYDNSVSPHRDYNQEGIEETIQGNIDNQMNNQQIKNKKAYVWAFGKNQEGELALGVYKDALLPRFVTGVKGMTAKWISSSNHHTAMITQDGQIVVSGSSLHGKLGIESNKTNINKFQIVPTLQRKRAKQVSCGDYHTLVLIEDGTVYQFGGSLFKDKKDKINRPQNPTQQIAPNVPQPVQALYGREIVQIDCGDFHSAALDGNGDLYTWGGGAPSYNKGQCGHGHNNALEYPEKVKYLSSKRIVKVACGGFHTLALTSENELYGFGSGNYGECGNGEFMDTSKPKLIKFPNDHLDTKKNVTDDLEEYGHDEEFVLEMYLKEQPQILDFAAGGRHSLIITNKGRLYSFGYGTNGQLGNVVQCAAGWNHSMILTERGDVFSCGYGGHGQLGHGDKDSRTQFTFVQSLGNKNISKIFAGGSHSWVVLDSVVPTRDKWTAPSPNHNLVSSKKSQSNNTPIRPINDFGNNSLSQSKGAYNNGRNSGISPYQNKFSANENDNQNSFGGYVQQQNQPSKLSMSNATFGGNGDQSFKNNQKPNINGNNENNTKSNTQLIPQGDDFIQKIIEIQHQQLLKAQFFLQITFCETEFCHRFVNFEVHGQFVKQFETLLEEYIQQQYQLEKGVLYHKIQEVADEFLQRKRQGNMTPGERLLKENQNDSGDENGDDQYSDLDDSFTPEEGHKGYTLCLICNPNACGYDEQFDEYKRQQGLVGKGKKIIVNSSSFQGSNQFKANTGFGEENSGAPLIGKIVFVKDTDIDSNPFEEQISKWMTNFNRKLAKYCIKKPRYSELRPMKFSLT
eukprot:403355741